MGTGGSETEFEPRNQVWLGKVMPGSGSLSDCISEGVRQFVEQQKVVHHRADYLPGAATPMLEWMATLYGFFVHETEVDEREAMLESIVTMVESGDLEPGGLLPLIRLEPHPSLVATLVIHYLRACNAGAGDEFAGVRELTYLVTEGLAANRGAVFAGLVRFGDRRITGAARAARGVLGVNDIREFARTHVAGLHAASIEFCLDWLLQLESTSGRSAFAHVASILTMMVVEDAQGIVIDTNNHVGPFGFRTVPEQVTKRFEDYLEEVMPVLRHIERTTQHPEVIENVIGMWREHADALAARRKVSNVHRVQFNA